MDDNIRIEWDSQNFYLILGGSEIQMSRVEAELLFTTLGNGLQDQDEMRKEGLNEREPE